MARGGAGDRVVVLEDHAVAQQRALRRERLGDDLARHAEDDAEEAVQRRLDAGAGERVRREAAEPVAAALVEDVQEDEQVGLSGRKVQEAAQLRHARLERVAARVVVADGLQAAAEEVGEVLAEAVQAVRLAPDVAKGGRDGAAGAEGPELRRFGAGLPREGGRPGVQVVLAGEELVHAHPGVVRLVVVVVIVVAALDEGGARGLLPRRGFGRGFVERTAHLVQAVGREGRGAELAGLLGTLDLVGEVLEEVVVRDFAVEAEDGVAEELELLLAEEAGGGFGEAAEGSVHGRLEVRG